MSKIYFSEVQELKKLLKNISYSQLFILVDKETEKHCYPLLKPYLDTHEVICVETGEENKTLESCLIIWQALTRHAADRNALLINLGGGVITDMGGFCASTYKRGINFANIPTTLLSQVDASVGGKTGIDFEGFKNHIGLFSEPEFVLIDVVFHASLPENQLRSGFAEMLKHGLIAQQSHWEQLKVKGFKKLDVQLIKQSVSIKEEIVSSDPNEKGLRKILNFGHTVGHAMESFCLSNKIAFLHGEAVALGMLAESFISTEKGFLENKHLEEIKEYITSVYEFPDIKKASFQEILRLCKQDKKNQKGKINMSLLKQPGEAIYNIEVHDSLIEASLNFAFN